MSKVLRVLDVMSGVVLLLMVVLAPWILGATTRETILLLNGLGFLAGGLWIVQRVVHSRVSAGREPSAEYHGTRWPTACVWGLVITLLGYVLCSALNPKAILQYTFTPGYPFASGVEIDYLDPIECLPQSHDQDRTLRAFWKYLAIVFSFAAARDWLVGASRRERRSDDDTSRFPGDRMQWLLWALAINAAAVS